MTKREKLKRMNKQEREWKRKYIVRARTGMWGMGGESDIENQKEKVDC